MQSACHAHAAHHCLKCRHGHRPPPPRTNRSGKTNQAARSVCRYASSFAVATSSAMTVSRRTNRRGSTMRSYSIVIASRMRVEDEVNSPSPIDPVAGLDPPPIPVDGHRYRDSSCPSDRRPFHRRIRAGIQFGRVKAADVVADRERQTIRQHPLADKIQGERVRHLLDDEPSRGIVGAR